MERYTSLISPWPVAEGQGRRLTRDEEVRANSSRELGIDSKEVGELCSDEAACKQLQKRSRLDKQAWWLLFDFACAIIRYLQIGNEQVGCAGEMLLGMHVGGKRMRCFGALEG